MIGKERPARIQRLLIIHDKPLRLALVRRLLWKNTLKAGGKRLEKVLTESLSPELSSKISEPYRGMDAYVDGFSAAVGEEGPYFQWHLQIMPRLVRPSGIELGPHVWINPMLPEECARRLQQACPARKEFRAAS